MAQYFISQEVLVDVAILTFAALVCVALRYPNRIQEIARAMVRPFLVALPLIAVVGLSRLDAGSWTPTFNCRRQSRGESL